MVHSLQGTAFPADKEMEPELRKSVEEGTDWAIFTTGIGTEALLELSKRLGFYDSFFYLVKQVKVATRGYKTYSTLKKLGILPIATDDDGTSRGLIRSLEPFHFDGKKVILQLHEERVPQLIAFLEEKGAIVK